MADSDPPWLKYQKQDAAPTAGAAGPWERFKTTVEKPAEKPPEEKTSPMQAAGAGLWRGLQDVLESGAGIGAKMLKTAPESAFIPEQAAFGAMAGTDDPARRQAMAAQVPQSIAQSNQAFRQNPAVQQHPIASTLGRVGGNVAASAPLMGVPGASGAGLGMAGRALMGAGMGGATGGLPGAVAGAGLGAAGSALGPPASQAMQAIAQKFPNLAGMATGAMGRSEEAFQRATANEVLFPIGEFVDRTVKVGHSLINEVGEKLNAAYNKLLPKVTFRPADTNPATGRSFNDSLREITDVVPEAFANDFTKLVKRVIEKPVEEGGGLLSGDAFKKAQSSIAQEARQFTKWNASPNEEKYGDILHDLQSAMRESLRAHNPTEAPMLEKVDQAWARYVRLQDASGRRVGGQGEFTPIDLLNAAKRGEGNRAFSEGNRLMQGFGTAGLNLVQGKPTNVQQILMNVAGAGVGAGTGALLGGPAGAAAGAAAGTAAGQMALPAMRGLGRLSRTDTLQELGKATSWAAPVAGAGEDRREPYVSATSP